jgi:hypothetical protein
MRAAMLEQRIGELKAIIARNDGRNAADTRFTRAVDDLISAFYDDIGQITDTPARALFDLFVIKVLYVGRRSCHADVIDYLASMLETFLYARELFPPDAEGKARPIYVSDLLDDERRAQIADSRFQAYRSYADRALFVTGVFRAHTSRRLPAQPTVLRRVPSQSVDEAYYVATGKTMYRMASRQDEAEQQRETLERLARFFEIYVEALNEMSARYILGFDLDLLADKMLDTINDFRATRDERSLAAARSYAAILQLDPVRYPALFSESA